MKRQSVQPGKKDPAASLWESRNFRIFVFFSALILLLIVSFCTAAYLKYRAVLKAAPEAELVKKASYQSQTENTPIGKVFRVSALFRVPWNLAPESVSFKTNTGVQTISDPIFEFDQYRWGANLWQVTASLQTYRNGRFSPGDFIVRFAGNKKSQSFSLPLPEINSVLPEINPEDDLIIASEITTKGKGRIWPRILFFLLGAGLLFSVLLVLRNFFRKSRIHGTPALWELAAAAIRKLREEALQKKISPEKAVSELTLLVRNYLERRFLLRAERQTTTEFLRDLENDDSPLPDSDRRFLKKFLVAADLVKFAHLSSDCDAFEHAAARAEKLILGSAPAIAGTEKMPKIPPAPERKKGGSDHDF